MCGTICGCDIVKAYCLRLSVVGAGVSETTGLGGRCQHTLREKGRARLILPFEVAKEEQLVLDDRSADVKPKIVRVERLLSALICQAGRQQCIVRESVCVESAVVSLPESVAMELVRSSLGDEAQRDGALGSRVSGQVAG